MNMEEAILQIKEIIKLGRSGIIGDEDIEALKTILDILDSINNQAHI